MFAFIFERIDQLTDRYHPEGGLMVIARSKEHVIQILSGDDSTVLTEEDWNNVLVYELRDSSLTPKVIKFPDSGCC